jgi:neural Wiskott-Aldrich syndrome protein
MSVNADEKKKIATSLGGTATPFAHSVARVLIAHRNGGGWQDTKLFGACCVTMDRSHVSKPRLLQLWDLQSFQKLFQHELYVGMTLTKLTPTFYSFEGENCTVGILFVKDTEASEVASKVSSLAPKATDASLSASRDRSGTSFFQRLGLGKKQPQDIGLPTDVKHVGHIGFDANEGTFDVNNIPADLKAVFKQANIKKSDLRDPEFAPVVNNIVNDYQAAQANQPPAAPPGGPPPVRGAPPVPPVQRRAPPPRHGPRAAPPVPAPRAAPPVPFSPPGGPVGAVPPAPAVGAVPPAPAVGAVPPAPAVGAVPPAPAVGVVPTAPPAMAVPAAPPAYTPTATPLGPPVRTGAAPAPVRVDLLASIRTFGAGGGGLRKVTEKERNAAPPPSAAAGPGGLLATLQAAMKNRRVQMHEEEEDEDDWSD